MCTRQDAAHVQSLLHSAQNITSSIVPGKLKQQQLILSNLQQDVQSMIQAAMDQSAASTQDLVESAVDSLSDASTAVQRQLDKLERSTVLALSLEELSEVSDALEQLVQTRQDKVADLHSNLKACQNDLGARISSVMLEGSTMLRDIGHATDGVVEQFLQERVQDFNTTALANSRAIEQVIASLEVVNVLLQKHVRQEYKLALKDWRLLHTKHVIAKFVEDVQATDCVRPLRCTALIEDLRLSQKDAAAEVTTCVLQDLLSVQSLATPQACQQSNERAEALLQRWQHDMSQRVEALNTALSEFKDLLMRLQEDLHKECCSYEGCSPQEVSDIIDKECSHILQSIQSETEDLVRQTKESCAAQYENWIKLVQTMKHFAIQCTSLVSTHSSKCAQDISNAKKTFTLMLDQFDSDHQDIEVTFEKVLQRISAASEQDIEEHRQEALQLLSTMKDGFHSAQQQAMNFVLQQIQTLRDLCKSHGVNLHSLLKVEHPEKCRYAAVEEGANSDDLKGDQNADSEALAGSGQAAEAACIIVHSQKFLMQQDLLNALLEPIPEPMEHGADVAEQQPPVANNETSQAPAESGAPDEAELSVACTLHEDPYVLPFPLEAIRAQLAIVITGKLEDDIEHTEQCLQEMEQWKLECREVVMSSLQEQLQKHRPRHGILEEDVCSKRQAVLRHQHLAVEMFLNKQAEHITEAVKEFDALRASISKQLEDRVQEQYTRLGSTLCRAQSRAAVEIVERAANAEHKKLHTQIEGSCNSLLVSSHQNLTEMGDVSERFKQKEMVLTHDGGTWASHTVQVCTDQLSELQTSMDKIKEKQSELVQNLKEEHFKKNNTMLQELTDSIPHHSEDTLFLEVANKEQIDAKRLVDSLLQRSREAGDKVDEMIETLNKEINITLKKGEGSCSLLQAANKVRLQLLSRASTLTALQSTGLVPVVVNLDIQQAPTAPAETPAPAKKGKGGKVETSEAAEPLAMELPKPLLQDVKSFLSAAQDALKAHATNYFSKRDAGRECTRNSIQQGTEAFLASRKDHFTVLQEQCDEHIVCEQKRFGHQVLHAYRIISAVPKAAYHGILEYKKVDMQKRVTANLHQLSQQLILTASNRKSHETELSPVLAHPSRQAALAELMDREETRRTEAINAICDTARSCRTTVVQGTAEAQQDLHNLAHIMGHLLNSWVMPQDLLPDVLPEDMKEMQSVSYQAMARLGSKVRDADSIRDENVTDSGDKTRPFCMGVWQIKQHAATNEDLGWTHEVQQMFRSEDTASDYLDARVQVKLKCFSLPLQQLSLAGFSAASRTAVSMGKDVLTETIARLQELQQQEDKVLRSVWMSMCAVLHKQ